MTITTNISKLTFNKMSEEKFQTIEPVDGEFYITPDDEEGIDESNLVHKDTEETITGNKTFSGGLDAKTPEENSSTSSMTVPTVGWVNDPILSTNVVHRSGSENIAGLKKFTGTVTVTDPAVDSNDGTVANTKWVNDKITPIQTSLSDKANSSDVYGKTETYTQTEIDEKLDTKADSTDVYTKTEADRKFLTEHQDISSLETGLATAQEDIESLTSDLAGKADSSNVNQLSETVVKKVDNVGSSPAVISAYPELSGITGVYVAKEYSIAHPTVLVICLDE